MLKQGIKKSLRYFGYEIHRSEWFAPGKNPCGLEDTIRIPTTQPPAIDPVWPLPYRPAERSKETIRKKFAKFDQWHYAYEFDGGLSISACHKNLSPLDENPPQRPLQRFRHFMPYLVEAENGSLKGKRILDIACNSGFWSIQRALLGAEVVGFDARPGLIEQANLIKSVVGIDNVNFKVLDFWDMSPRSLDGTFDIVLNPGILYHLPSPLEALRLTKAMARRTILLDTEVYQSDKPVIKLMWEEPTDIRMADSSGIVTFPSKSSIELMFRATGVIILEQPISVI